MGPFCTQNTVSYMTYIINTLLTKFALSRGLDISVLLVVICLVHINKNQANVLTSRSFNNPLHWPMTSEAFYPRYGVLSSLTVSSFVAIWVVHLMTKNQTLLIYNYYICFIVNRLYMSIGEFLISWCERYRGEHKIYSWPLNATATGIICLYG